MAVFVCRDAVLSAVTSALARPPSLVLVEGEAGIGKTRLVQECLWSGRWPERTVLTVQCQAVTKSMLLAPVVDGLRRLREELGDVELSPLGGALRLLFPEWEADLPPQPQLLEDPGARRHQLYRAMSELVDRLAVDLVVVEDAHWADPSSLEWLLVVWESWGDRRSVVVTYRRGDVPADSPLWQMTTRRPSGMGKLRVVLEPLDVAGIQQLTAAMFQTGEVSREFAEFVYERTEGLPLAVEECLKLLRDRGDIVRQDGGWGRKELAQMRQVPPHLRDSVLERVERLDLDTRRVLDAAAVLGEPADDRLLAQVADIDPEAARSGVAAGFRAGLLRGSGRGRVEFRHQLTADAVAEEIPISERRRLHQRAGDALRDAEVPSVARLCRHFKEAGDVESWARHAETAADQTHEAGDDLTAAAMLYELLTSMEHPGTRRARLARKLGETVAGGAAGLTGQAGPVVEVLQRVVAGSDIPPSERGAIRMLLARLLRWSGQREAADRQVEAAIPDLGDRPELACWAMLNMGVAFSRDQPVSWHLDWIGQATARFSQIESAAERLHVEALRVSALLGLGEMEGWSSAAQLPRTGSGPSEQRMILLSAADIGRLAIKWGRYDEARTQLTKATEGIRAVGYQRASGVARMGCAYLAWYTGQWAGLGDMVAELAKADATEQPDRVEAREIQSLLDLATGARKAAEQRLQALLEAHALEAPLGHQAATTAGALGRLRLADGTAEQALQATGPVMARIARKRLWLWATDAIWVHLDALVSRSELRQAEELAGQLAGWLAGRHAPAPAAAAVLCQAIVTEANGKLDEAADQYAQAADAWAALPRPYDQLLALERQGRCLLAADESERGLALLFRAQQRLRDLGANWDADRVAHLLRQQGADVPRSRLSGPRGDGNQLTTREREVLALVAQGMTNREAGAVMYLSPKTIGHYLSNAMRKLGASTRTGAAMAAAEAGLLPPGSEDSIGTSANG